MLAIKALKNPPLILPEHESMQDYIDIIEEQGLLKFDTKDEEQQPQKRFESNNSLNMPAVKKL